MRSSGIGRARLPSITSMVEKRSTRPRRTACLWRRAKLRGVPSSEPLPESWPGSPSRELWS
eukprot:13698451-Alexandrium_andersonii.AAC.1